MDRFPSMLEAFIDRRKHVCLTAPFKKGPYVWTYIWTYLWTIKQPLYGPLYIYMADTPNCASRLLLILICIVVVSIIFLFKYSFIFSIFMKKNLRFFLPLKVALICGNCEARKVFFVPCCCCGSRHNFSKTRTSFLIGAAFQRTPPALMAFSLLRRS